MLIHDREQSSSGVCSDKKRRRVSLGGKEGPRRDATRKNRTLNINQAKR